MGWFRIEAGRLRYRSITHAPFAAWLETPRAAVALADASQRIGFRLLGRTRAARNALCRQLQDIAADDRIRAIIDDQACAYPTSLASLAFLESLPRTTVDLRRIVVVPRLLLNARAHHAMDERIAEVIRSGRLEGGEALRTFFVTTLVDEMDRALAIARPTAARPVPAHEGWASVGVNLHFKWDVADWSGPAWPGHHYVYERPPGGLGRGQRRRLEATIREIEASLDRWPRQRRHETLQRAASAAAI